MKRHQYLTMDIKSPDIIVTLATSRLYRRIKVMAYSLTSHKIHKAQ